MNLYLYALSLFLVETKVFASAPDASKNITDNVKRIRRINIYVLHKL
jgi:hypothetical protein